MTCLESLRDDVQQSSAIEGEDLPRDQVRSSLARRLGIDIGGVVCSDHAVERRQRKVLARFLDDFKGNLTTEKFAKIASTSRETALRDVNALIALSVLVRVESGGRSSSYLLAPGRYTPAIR